MISAWTSNQSLLPSVRSIPPDEQMRDRFEPDEHRLLVMRRPGGELVVDRGIELLCFCISNLCGAVVLRSRKQAHPGPTPACGIQEGLYLRETFDFLGENHLETESPTDQDDLVVLLGLRNECGEPIVVSSGTGVDANLSGRNGLKAPLVGRAGASGWQKPIGQSCRPVFGSYATSTGTTEKPLSHRRAMRLARHPSMG